MKTVSVIQWGTLMLAAMLITSTARAELNWKSSGTPSVSCEVTSTESGLLFFGEWTKINLAYYVTEESGTRLEFHCEGSKRLAHDGSCCVKDCRKQLCIPVKSPRKGNSYILKGETAILIIEPGVSKMDACSRLFKSAGVTLESVEK